MTDTAPVKELHEWAQLSHESGRDEGRADAFERAADRIEALTTENAALREALAFYTNEVEALARYMRSADKAEAIEAVITVLSLDGGKRGRAALSPEGML